jgi:putative DNA primase/helicase
MNYNTVCDEPKQIQFINTWLKDPTNRTYNNIDFLPKQEAPDGVYNTFTNYEVDNKILHDNIKLEDSMILEHLNNLCGNDIAMFNYVVAFLARKLQQPYKLTNTSLIFKSVEGCGKDMFFNWFGSEVLGSRYYLNEDKTELIFGRFNSCIENKILIVLNEASGKDTYNLSNCIKNAISRKINNIECKGMSPFNNTNHIGYISLTNNKNPMKVDAEDRRFVGIECNNKIANNNEYFCKLDEQLKSGKYDKLFYNYLMAIDVDTYDFTNNRPTSEFYNNMKQANIPVLALFFENLTDETRIVDIQYKIKANDLFLKFQLFLKDGNFKNEITLTRFGIDIKEYEGITKIKTMKGNFYCIDFDLIKPYLTTKYNMVFESEDFLDDTEVESDDE